MRGTPYLLLVACAEHQVAYIGEASGGRDRLDCLGAVVIGVWVWCGVDRFVLGLFGVR